MMAKLLEAVKGLSPRNRIIAAVVAAVLLIAILAGLYFALSHEQPKPEQPRVQAPPPPPPPPPRPEPKPEPPVVEAPPAPPLPKLEESDGMLLESMQTLVGDPSLLKFLLTERIIRNIVATVDNLPGKQAPMRVRPIRKTPGQFLVTGGEDRLVVSRKNAARYAPYVKVAEAVDSKKLAELYVRLYPLFQQAYEELGYPKKYFNDRLIEALDDMLSAPDIKEPIRLVQPKVFYLYADPDLEARSIGQRILMRTGSNNEAALKAKLAELKQELLLHVRDGKVVNTAAPAGSAPGEAAPAVK